VGTDHREEKDLIKKRIGRGSQRYLKHLQGTLSKRWVGLKRDREGGQKKEKRDMFE